MDTINEDKNISAGTTFFNYTGLLTILSIINNTGYGNICCSPLSFSDDIEEQLHGPYIEYDTLDVGNQVMLSDIGIINLRIKGEEHICPLKEGMIGEIMEVEDEDEDEDEEPYLVKVLDSTETWWFKEGQLKHVRKKIRYTSGGAFNISAYKNIHITWNPIDMYLYFTETLTRNISECCDKLISNECMFMTISITISEGHEGHSNYIIICKDNNTNTLHAYRIEPHGHGEGGGKQNELDLQLKVFLPSLDQRIQYYTHHEVNNIVDVDKLSKLQIGLQKVQSKNRGISGRKDAINLCNTFTLLYIRKICSHTTHPTNGIIDIINILVNIHEQPYLEYVGRKSLLGALEKEVIIFNQTLQDNIYEHLLQLCNIIQNTVVEDVHNSGDQIKKRIDIIKRFYFKFLNRKEKGYDIILYANTLLQTTLELLSIWKHKNFELSLTNIYGFNFSELIE